MLADRIKDGRRIVGGDQRREDRGLPIDRDAIVEDERRDAGHLVDTELAERADAGGGEVLVPLPFGAGRRARGRNERGRGDHQDGAQRQCAGHGASLTAEEAP